MDRDQDQKVDIYRHTPLRYLVDSDITIAIVTQQDDRHFHDWHATYIKVNMWIVNFVITNDKDLTMIQSPIITTANFMGYANEVGEAFRGAIHIRYVKLSYIIAGGYVLADTCSKSSIVSDRFKSESDHDYQVALKFTETLTWQSLASVMIPGLVINRCCATFNSVMKAFPIRNRQLITTALGLALIPLIIKPIDRSVDKAMDNYITPTIQHLLATLYHDKTDSHNYTLAEAVMYDYNT